MNENSRRMLLPRALCGCGGLTASAQSIDGPLQVGYVTVTHESPTTAGPLGFRDVWTAARGCDDPGRGHLERDDNQRSAGRHDQPRRRP